MKLFTVLDNVLELWNKFTGFDSHDGPHNILWRGGPRAVVCPPLNKTIVKTTRNTLDCDQSNYSSRIVFLHIPIEFGQTDISGHSIRQPRKPHPRTKHGLNWMIRRGDIAISIFPAASRHLGFGKTGNSAIRSADLEHPTVEPNMKRI